MSDESPTTVNGPLHTPDATTEDRVVRATYATADAARAAREALVQSGIAAERIAIVDNAADSAEVQASLKPKDERLFARVRDMVVPDDSTTATRQAVKDGDAILELRPTAEEVDKAVSILEASGPSHFDARLERWRNAG